MIYLQNQKENLKTSQDNSALQLYTTKEILKLIANSFVQNEKNQKILFQFFVFYSLRKSESEIDVLALRLG